MLCRLFEILGCETADAKCPTDQSDEQLDPFEGYLGFAFFEVAAKMGFRHGCDRGSWYCKPFFWILYAGCILCSVMISWLALFDGWQTNEKLAWASMTVRFNTSELQDPSPFNRRTASLSQTSESIAEYAKYYNETYGINLSNATDMVSDLKIGIYRVVWDQSLLVDGVWYTDHCNVKYDHCSADTYSRPPCFTTKASSHVCASCFTGAIFVNVLSVFSTWIMWWLARLGSLRSNVLTDSRSLKLRYFLLAFLGTTLNTVFIWGWHKLCKENLAPEVGDLRFAQSLGEVHWDHGVLLATMPIFVLSVFWLLNLATPVPEAYFSTWLKRNSDAARHLERAMACNSEEGWAAMSKVGCKDPSPMCESSHERNHSFRASSESQLQGQQSGGCQLDSESVELHQEGVDNQGSSDSFSCDKHC